MMGIKRDLREDLDQILSEYHQDNNSQTPGFILARYVTDCLKAFDRATRKRTKWFACDEDDDEDYTGANIKVGGTE